jgi:hypothetical protein
MSRVPRSFALVLLLAAPLAGAADLVSVSSHAQLTLTVTPEEQVCAGVLAPLPARDASDALAFATGPTARLDEQELWAANSLAPLAAIRYAAGGLHLVLIGFPVETQIRFTQAAGWRPRWPFC